MRSRPLVVYVGAVICLFAGLVLLTARSPFSVVFIAAAIAAMFVTAYSSLSRPTSPTFPASTKGK